ncbi:sigma 54-interacting transcriptional regulator [Luteimonas sp. TWI662]|uniref:sigma-54-dependent transcriptional regulator n=1 Tax=Luteimonas sp. TWI662 TaxID=3136789 RepID=UPI00320A9385
MSQPTVLILDDDGTFSRAAGQLAFAAGLRVQLAETLAEARGYLSRARADLMLLDLQLPDGSGLDLLDDIDLAEHGQIAIVTGRPTVESAARAVASPVIEYLVKPLDAMQLRRLMERVVARYQPTPSPDVPGAIGDILGNSPQIRRVVDQVLRIGATDAPVLVWGERGTGKTLVARALHSASGRQGPFVTLDCSATDPDRLATELFDATGSLGEAFVRARGGTLLLADLTAIPMALQARLLRALEAGPALASPDARLIASTHRDPHEAMREGTLRDDLYHVLTPLPLPPLRERGEDVAVLAQVFLDKLNAHYGRSRRLASGAESALLRHDWPGNVRELRSAVQGAYLLQQDDDLYIRPTLPSETVLKESETSIMFSVGTTLAELERRALLKTLAHFNNDKTATARALGISVRTVHNQLARLAGPDAPQRKAAP